MFRIAICLVMIASTAHANEESPADKLKASLPKWEKLREDCGGNYSYSVRWTSFVGFGHITTVTVRKNQVVERKFEEITAPQPGAVPNAPKVKWVETGKEIGSHKEGAPARTLDDMYAEAKKLIDAPHPPEIALSIAFDKNGVLQYCFTRDRRIADDAPTQGIKPFQLMIEAKK